MNRRQTECKWTCSICRGAKEEDDSQWVNDPLDDDVQYLEIEKKVFSKPSDDQVWQEIIKIAGVTCSSDFQKIDKTKQRETLGQLRELGASVRQLEGCG